MSSASPRRRQLLDAALHVIADEGLRGLTHRAVDRRAGLPEGTCSAFFAAGRGLNAGGGFSGAMPLVQVTPAADAPR